MPSSESDQVSSLVSPNVLGEGIGRSQMVVKVLCQTTVLCWILFVLREVNVMDEIWLLTRDYEEGIMGVTGAYHSNLP